MEYTKGELGISPSPWKWQGEDYRGGWGWQMLVDANGDGIIIGDENGEPSRHIKAYMPADKELCGTGCIAEDKERVNSVHVFSPANAHLIAAAPSLYEAGKDALNLLKLWANQHPADEVLAMVITQLEQALAKAEVE